MSQPVLHTESDTSFVAEYEWPTFRFLLNDGRTIDVRAIRDDSDLRSALLAKTGASGIAGVVKLETPAAPEQPAKKVPSKRAS